MPQAISLLLPNEDAAEIRRIAQRERRFPLIAFRSIPGERVACLKGRLEVWQVILVAHRYAGEGQVIPSGIDQVKLVA